jgi:hypothetical protein
MAKIPAPELPVKTNKPSKYHAVQTNGYASKKESRVAQELHLRQRAGEISDLREQVPFVLVEGRNGVQPVTYIADFVYREWRMVDGLRVGKDVVADAKGMRTDVYKLKARMMYLLMGITVVEL